MMSTCKNRSNSRNKSKSEGGGGGGTTSTCTSSSSSWRQQAGLKNNDHAQFLQRIRKSLYYNELPSLPRFSLPLSEIASETFSEVKKGKSLKRLYLEDAAEFTRNACVSPCSLVLALLYLERLKVGNPEYVKRIAPSELFFVSLMISTKFLQDSGEDEDVISDEWAVSAGLPTESLIKLERDFLKAIDWKVFVSENDFLKRLAELESEVALKQSKSRGWFTYTDLANVILTMENVHLLKCLVTVYLALSISYIASISTLMISSVITRETSLSLAKSWNSTTATTCEIANRLDANDCLNTTVNIDIDIQSETYFKPDDVQNIELNDSRQFLGSTDSNHLFLYYKQTLLDNLSVNVDRWKYYYFDKVGETECDHDFANRDVFADRSCKNSLYLFSALSQPFTLSSSC